MKNIVTLITMMVFVVFAQAQDFEKDVFATSEGDLEITFIAHGTLMMQFNGKVIHIDPVSWYADYAIMPKADLVLITHEHGDHLDAKAIDAVKKEGTQVVLTKTCNEKYAGIKYLAMANREFLPELKLMQCPLTILNTNAKPDNLFTQKE